MKCYLLYTRRRQIGVPTLCISPNIISPWNTLCDLGSHCLQTLFYQFYKTGTSLNIIESHQMLHDATPSLDLQYSNLGKDKENARLPALIPVTDVKWFGSRPVTVSLVWPGSNCLHVTSPCQGGRDKSRWISMDIYTCVKNNFHIEILRSAEIWVIGCVSLCLTSHQKLSRSYGDKATT